MVAHLKRTIARKKLLTLPNRKTLIPTIIKPMTTLQTLNTKFIMNISIKKMIISTVIMSMAIILMKFTKMTIILKVSIKLWLITNLKRIEHRVHHDHDE
jgi:hypothetical protein